MNCISGSYVFFIFFFSFYINVIHQTHNKQNTQINKLWTQYIYIYHKHSMYSIFLMNIINNNKKKNISNKCWGWFSCFACHTKAHTDTLVSSKVLMFFCSPKKLRTLMFFLSFQLKNQIHSGVLQIRTDWVDWNILY